MGLGRRQLAGKRSSRWRKSAEALSKSGWRRLNRLRAPVSDQPAWPQEFFSQLEAPGIVQREHGNGGPAGWCYTVNERVPVYKVIRPPVSPGVKQNLYLARHRVDSTEVWAFVQIAAMAREREIFDIIAAAVLTGDNVFDLMRHRAMLLAELAVLTTISCSVSDKKPGSAIHR